MLKQDVLEPSDQQNLITKVNMKYFEDTSNFLAKTKHIKPMNLGGMVEKILYSDRVQNEIRKLSSLEGKPES